MTTPDAQQPPTQPADEAQVQKPLKVQWKRFVMAYLLKPNMTQAAISAGYSEKSARTQGPFLMRQPAIQAAIAHYEQQTVAKSDLNTDWVIARLRLEATSMLNSGTDRIHSLDLLGKWLGMWAGEGAHLTINVGGELDGLSREQLRHVLDTMDAKALGPGEGEAATEPGSLDFSKRHELTDEARVAGLVDTDIEGPDHPTLVPAPAVLPPNVSQDATEGVSNVESERVNLHGSGVQA